jgi:pimeloyl-ACP methyl ester carboxylesterase
LAPTNLIEPRFMTVDGLRIRFADSGGPDSAQLLLTSPWPESLYAFAGAWPTLRQHARLFAVDLPGFGRSQGRRDVLSPRAMGAFLHHLIARAGLVKPHIVAPEGGVPEWIREDYVASYAGDRFVESMAYVRRYPDELPELAELLRTVTMPVTIVNGRHDPVVPVGNAEFLHARLPHSRMVLIEAAHFVWEEAPAEYAAAILDSIPTGVP